MSGKEIYILLESCLASKIGENIHVTYIQLMLQLLYLKHAQISASVLLETESNHHQR